MTKPYRVDYYDIDVASTRDNKDLMTVDFILCHEGTNKKGGRFNAQELRAAYHTPIFKPINWEHRSPIIGVVSEAALKQDENKQLFVGCKGHIWKFKFPEFANYVKKGAEVGTLGMSMECWYTDYNIVVGDYDYTVPEKEADKDLIKSIGTYVDDKYVSKEYVNLIFGGVGVTGTPADPEARILACASDRTDEEWHDYLHKAYSKLIETPMTEEQIIMEHELVTVRLLDSKHRSNL